MTLPDDPDPTGPAPAPAAGPSSPEPHFRPRLSEQLDTDGAKPPYNPKSYYLVAFFAGPLALAAVAGANLSKVARSDETRRRTWLAIGLMLAATVVLLAVTPSSWWDPVRNIRFGVRGLAVVGALVLDRVQRGPAFAAAASAGEFASMWKAIVPIGLAALALAAITVAFALIRGVPLG